MNSNYRLELIGNKKVTIFPSNIDNVQVARQIAQFKNNKGLEASYYVVDIGQIIKLFLRWNALLPRIQPFYAVKCNGDEVLLKVLADLGCGFDVASKAELDLVVKRYGIPPRKVIYANPCKTQSFIRHAYKSGVDMMTFDNEEELEKIAVNHPSAQMVLRIAIGDPTAQCPLSIKFGCDPIEEAPKLLLSAMQKSVEVIGISFHVGSGCNDAETFRVAITHARALFDIGNGLGHKMKILDIGGGFPGSETASLSFENIVNVIAPCVDEYFPPSSDVTIIAEPGRYFACSPFSLVTHIVASTRVPASRITKDGSSGDGYMYYMNDGVYGSFNCILYDHNNPIGYPLHDKEGDMYPCTIWGPTCDGLDKVEDCRILPHLNAGDWMYYKDMGAYTCAASTTFNGFEKPKMYYYMEEHVWQMMYGCAE